MRSDAITVMRVVTALLCAVAGLLLLLAWGMGMKFWSLVGAILVLMSFGAAYLVAGRDYVGGATPAALAGIVASFVLLPPEGMNLAAVVILFIAAGLAFALYEVD
ncbi:MAG: hypothetical protein FJ149_03715 [Euryarchaeota archaeon]|nr:hypothetical protein [Euryarchaeota archaeon]